MAGIRISFGVAILWAAVLPLRAWAGDYDDRTIPGKWLNAVVPKNVAEPGYEEYEKDDALERARAQIWAGQYRRGLVTLSTIKKGHVVKIALLRARAQMALGRWEEAKATLGGPGVEKNGKARILLAQVFAGRGEFGKALSIAEGLAAENVDDIAAHYYVGKYREAVGNVFGAKAAYQWFVSGDHNYLKKWMAKPTDFSDAEEVTLLGKAVDRWATLTLVYQQQRELHDIVMGMFVRAYDLIDRDYWPAHVAAAEYLLLHDDPEAADAELEQALTANPFDIGAWSLAGRIAVEQFNFNGAEMAIDHIRQVNLDSVEGDLLEARDRLQERDAGSAVGPLERILARQPHNFEAMGLLAGAEDVLLQDGKAAEMLKEVDGADADNAEAYLEVADQLAAMRQYPRAAEMYKVAIQRAPWWSAPRNGLGLLYTQSGDEDSSRTVLEAAHTLDPFNPRTTNYLRLLDMMGHFAKKETAHFVVTYDAVQDPVIPEYFGDYLESVYKTVCDEYHYEPTAKTLIEVFPTHDEFSVRTTGAPWIATVGASSGRVIALVAPRKGERTMGPFDWSQVLRHEFTHTVTLGATDNRIAHWLTEGLAVREEHVPIRWEWVPMLYDAVMNNHLLKMDELTWGFIRPRHPSERALAYAESNWICNYIEAKYGHEAILAMLEQFRLGRGQNEVFVNCLHRSQDQFFGEFVAWCHDQIDGWGYDAITGVRYQALRSEGERAIADGHYDIAISDYEEIEKIRPVDLLPHRRLAGLYARTHQEEKEIGELDKIAASELKDNMYAKGAARIERDLGHYDLAAARALHAVYVDPYDASAHKLLEEIDEKLGDAAGSAREKRVIEELAHWQERADSAQGSDTTQPAN